MQLDFNPATQAFFLRVPRADAPALMENHGLDLSLSASTAREGVLFTHDVYAAASFRDDATPAALAALGWVAVAIDASWALSSARHVAVPAGRELWPYQVAGVDYVLGREHALIGDDPGCGKTMQAICVANEMQAGRVLVVCPAAIRLQWCQRIKEWSTMRAPFVSPVTAARYGTSTNADWLVVSYDMVRRPAVLRSLLAQRFDLLILDEVQACKTIGAKRTRAVFGYHDHRGDAGAACLADVSARILALSGTPFPNRPGEAYVAARGLCHEAIDWSSQQQFSERYNLVTRHRAASGKVWTSEQQGRLPELQNRMRAHFMCRHLKRDVMPQLKMPVYDIVQAEETGPVRQALQAERLLDIDPALLTGASAEILGQVSTARRLMGMALAPQAVEYATACLDAGEAKLVVFGWHIEVLDTLAAGLAEFGVVRVLGSDSAAGKAAKVARFIADPSARVILGNLLSLGTGVDGLQQVCNHAVIAEPSWVPGENKQAFDRLDRGGQTRQVQGDIIVAPGSIAERILATALTKDRTLDKVLDWRG